MRIRFSLLLLPTVAVLIAATAAHAQAGHGRGAQPVPAIATQSRQDSTLPDSIRRVERQTGGEVLRAEPMQQDGRQVNRIKVLTADGRVRVMQDDPEQADNDPAPRKHKGATPVPKSGQDDRSPES